MTIFQKCEPEEFLIFQCNFQIVLEAAENIVVVAKTQYICTLLHGEALHEFETLS